MGMQIDPLIRFVAKVEPTDDCWRWMGTILPNGYGHFRGYGSKMILAHRFAYEEFVGSIPQGLQIDHLCRNRWCVNPDHLEPVTNRENAFRGVAPSIALHLAGRCARGHSRFYVVNTSERGPRRRCRECENEWQRIRRAKRRAARAKVSR
jgi:HNH endonuclease